MDSQMCRELEDRMRVRHVVEVRWMDRLADRQVEDRQAVWLTIGGVDRWRKSDR